jgi:hypothetical protein
MRFLQICSDCRITGPLEERWTRVWEEVRCPLCARFYCRRLTCLKPLAVGEEALMVRCASCDTEHHYSGRGPGKICTDRPVTGVPKAKPGALSA